MPAGTLVGRAPVPDPATPGNILLPWARQKITDVCRPGLVIIDAIIGAFDFTKLTAATVSYGGAKQNEQDASGEGTHPAFSGKRTGYTLEGPFIQYSVMRGQIDREQLDRQPAFRGQYEETQPNVSDFFFDLQCKRPIYFPYPGSISVVTQYPGAWKFNAIVLEDSADTERPSPIQAELPLTMNIAPSVADVASFRTFNAIPPGAHSFTWRDGNASNDPTIAPGSIALLIDSTPDKAPSAGPAGALNPSVTLKDPYTLSSSFYTRWGVGNANALTVTGARTKGVGMLTWHVSLL